MRAGQHARECRLQASPSQHPASQNAQLWSLRARGRFLPGLLLHPAPAPTRDASTPRACVSGPRLHLRVALHHCKYTSIPCGLQSVTSLQLNVSVCLSVPHPDQEGIRLDIPWDIPAGVQELDSSGKQCHPGRRGQMLSSSGPGRSRGLEEEPQDWLPRHGDALLSGGTAHVPSVP